MKHWPNKDFYNFKLYTDLPAKDWATKAALPSQTTAIVVRSATESSLALLEKILGAVQQELERDCFLIQQETAAAYKDIKQKLAFRRLLVFGWAPADLGLHLQIKPYQLVNFEERQLLFAHDLATIAENNNEEKQLLWRQLQQLFKNNAL
jgi:hypothetical protein